MANIGSDTDRRRFFRIDDRLQLALRRLQGVDGESESGLRATEVLADIDRRIASIVAAARMQAPAVGELAELLNRKLNYVIEALDLREEVGRRVTFHEREVSISACGIGLHSAEAFVPGETVVVELVLPPEDTHLRVPSRVVHCGEDGHGGYRLQIDFAGIELDDQEILIQFIVRRQGHFLQQLREQRDTRPPRLVS